MAKNFNPFGDFYPIGNIKSIEIEVRETQISLRIISPKCPNIGNYSSIPFMIEAENYVMTKWFWDQGDQIQVVIHNMQLIIEKTVS